MHVRQPVETGPPLETLDATAHAQTKRCRNADSLVVDSEGVPDSTGTPAFVAFAANEDRPVRLPRERVDGVDDRHCSSNAPTGIGVAGRC